jgi:predicted nucleic acid-binding protein
MSFTFHYDMQQRMAVYLDTSVVSALFDSTNPERRSLTLEFFRTAADYRMFVSEITIDEIERTPDTRLRTKMKQTISGYDVLTLTDSAISLAGEYIRYGAVPESSSEDAYHIAIAVENRVDFILSWNFKHIVRRRTRDIVKMVNTLRAHASVEIVTPAELL